jgi:heme/copper-type cytochrome/quinol oxidase subunit 2
MFSQGQLLFALFFVITFVALIIFAYRKDSKNHKVHYEGSIKIFIAFVLTIGILFLIKFLTQNP